uniref:non-specific serine/threonine protein kinase n=1 Tax=Gouania willdenowi TaxID=441366 RepID=A0A8C5GQJ1_GOUWI
MVKLYDSFQTQSDVVIVTEFVKEELFHILEQNGCFSKGTGSEHRLPAGLCSILFTLPSHYSSNIKPENNMLGKDNTVNVSTMVLTSLKGTPLYDLWSLACILYQPPFNTDTLFQLDNCMSFLKVLLTKDPLHRLSWPDLQHHLFVADVVVVVPDVTLSSPLTTSPLLQEVYMVLEKQIYYARQNVQEKKKNPTIKIFPFIPKIKNCRLEIIKLKLSCSKNEISDSGSF